MTHPPRHDPPRDHPPAPHTPPAPEAPEVSRADAIPTDSPAADPALTHLDDRGGLRMVDVGDKPATRRTALAQALVKVSPELADAIGRDQIVKGNLLETAKLAGILAAKRTAELIPLCHSLPLDSVELDLQLQQTTVRIRATARTTWSTGVEMEALTAASVAALTVIDMGKAIDPGMVVHDLRLLEKTGGKHGTWRSPDPGADPP